MFPAVRNNESSLACQIGAGLVCPEKPLHDSMWLSLVMMQTCISLNFPQLSTMSSSIETTDISIIWMGPSVAAMHPIDTINKPKGN